MNEKEIREHRAIPYGESIFLALIVIATATVYGMAILARSWWHSEPASAVVWCLIGSAIFVMAPIGALTLCGSICGGKENPIAWLRAYNLRNIDGYMAWYHRCPLEAADALRVDVLKRGYFPTCGMCVPMGQPHPLFAIGIPLGGWFHRPKIHVDGMNSGWLERRAMTYRVAHISRDDVVPKIRVTDAWGNCLTMNVAYALDFLTSRHEFAPGGDMPTDSASYNLLAHLVSVIDRARKEARKERDEARTRLASVRETGEQNAQYWRDEAVRITEEREAILAQLNEEQAARANTQHQLAAARRTITGAIEKIHRASRYGHSIDGLRIRIEVLKEYLDKCVPMSALENGDLNRDLADAEAELKRRERHKKHIVV